jgi:hypothetical protein
MAGCSARPKESGHSEPEAFARAAFCCRTRSVTSRQRDRSPRCAVDRNEGEGHFDVELPPALAHCAGHRGTPVKLRNAHHDRVVEPAPVRGAKIARHDEIEVLTRCLLGAQAEKRRRGAVPTGIVPAWSAKIMASAAWSINLLGEVRLAWRGNFRSHHRRWTWGLMSRS